MNDDQDEICGAYAEYWKEIGMPEGWKGCNLPKGHEGNHMTVVRVVDIGDKQEEKQGEVIG